MEGNALNEFAIVRNVKLEIFYGRTSQETSIDCMYIFMAANSSSVILVVFAPGDCNVETFP